MAGLFAGVGPALLLVSAPAVQFWSFESMSRAVRRFRLRAGGGVMGAAQAPARAALATRAAATTAAAGAALSSEAKAAATLTNRDLFVLGALSKICSTVVTFPLQTVKTNLAKGDGGDGHRFTGLRECAGYILKTEGARGFYAGVQSKLLQTSLTAAVLFVVRLRLLALLMRARAG